jgi:hypothetical protein
MKSSLVLILVIHFCTKITWAQTEFSQIAIDTDKQMKKSAAANAPAAPTIPAPAASAATKPAPAAPTTPTPATTATSAPATVTPPTSPSVTAPAALPQAPTAVIGFPEIKAKLLANLDKKIALINDHRVCIEASQNADEVKKCDEKLRAENQKLKDEAKQKQMQKIDENIKNLESKKKELEQKS